MARKGSSYERAICKALSLWWTDGTSDAVFWRTSTSGARATSRRKRGKSTHGQHGDVCATDPIGEAFCRALAVEIKKGYSKFSPFDVLDKPKRGKPQLFEEWMAQAEDSCQHGGTLSWLIIFKRDKRQAMVAFPERLLDKFLAAECNQLNACDGMSLHFWMKSKGSVRVMRLDDFLKHVTPEAVRRIA